MDNITPKVFEAHLTDNIQIISKKVLAGAYSFTRYREILISKGRGKEPRVISIPTIRDKLALAAYYSFYRMYLRIPLKNLCSIPLSEVFHKEC